MEPTSDGHDATLYFRPTAGRDSDEFYANPDIGEFWTGPRPPLASVASDLALATASLDDLADVLDAVDANTIVVRDGDRDLTDQVDGRRLLVAESEALETDGDLDLARDLSELRLVKDAYEIDQMRRAVDATRAGFDDVIADRPAIIAHPRGERLVEGTFNRRARAEGNAVGYDTIAASGPHACILHWTRNDGAVVPGDLILMDAGIELDDATAQGVDLVLEVEDAAHSLQADAVAGQAGHLPQQLDVAPGVTAPTSDGASRTDQSHPVVAAQRLGVQAGELGRHRDHVDRHLGAGSPVETWRGHGRAPSNSRERRSLPAVAAR
jgi:Xaa-Pro aminopeptidase